jgi:hypothetical protein
MAKWARYLKVSKTDAFVIDASDWANGEAVTVDTITSVGGLASVGTATVSAGLITVLLTGLTEGIDQIEFEYSTATRNDCYLATLVILADCT